MVCLPLLAPRPPNPLDSERPFFSMTTKGEGSDCAGTFTGPLCFQMVLFSCDTVDTQHLPRIRTLLWGSTEGRWVVCGCEGRGRVRRQQRAGMKGPEKRGFLGLEFSLWENHLPPLSSVLMVFCPDSFLNDDGFIFCHPRLLWLLCPTLFHTAFSPVLSSSAPCAPLCLQAFTLFNLLHP